MRSVVLFMMISLDGFFEGPGHDLSWHNVDLEFNQFAAAQMNEMGTILFGRRTYDLMAKYWPTAKPSDPYDSIVAEKMNTLPKVVFSKTLNTIEENPNWRNVTLSKNDLKKDVENLKSQPGKPIVILGSNNLSVEFLERGLIDEIRIMLNPIVIGSGTLLFQGLKNKLSLQLQNTRTFTSGNVLLSYHPYKH